MWCESWSIKKAESHKWMLLNCGFEDSLGSLELQGNPTSPFWRRSALGFLWKEWCNSWNSSSLATSCEELTHWKRLNAGRDGDRRRRRWQKMRWLDGITESTDTSLSELLEMVMDRDAWHLRFMGSQRVGHDWATERNRTELNRETVIENIPMDMGRGEDRVRCIERVTWKLTLPYVK